MQREIKYFELAVLTGEEETQANVDEGIEFDILQTEDPNAMLHEHGGDDTVKGSIIEGEIDKKRKREAIKTGRVKIDSMQLSFEVTFEIFEERFIGRWYRYMSKGLSKKLSPSFIWTELQSIIKGSIDFGIYVKHLSQKQYY